MSAMSAPARADAKLRTEMLRWMRLARALEDRVARMQIAGVDEFEGTQHSRGHEAVSVGAALHMRAEDIAAPGIRDLGALLVRGISPRQILAQGMGKKTGPTRGRDGGLRIGSMGNRLIAFVSAFADSVPVAAGAALAFKIGHTDQVAFCFFTEGAVSRGDWHEGINFAAVQRLPVVYICSNSRWSEASSRRHPCSVESVADRSVAYNIPGVTVDGCDILAVYQAVGDAAQRARRGEGPSIIEGRTVDLGRPGAVNGDGAPRQGGRPQAEKLDPIARFVADLRVETLIDDAKLAAMDAEIAREIEEAAVWAEAQPDPDPAECLDGVYAQYRTGTQA